MYYITNIIGVFVMLVVSMRVQGQTTVAPTTVAATTVAATTVAATTAAATTVAATTAAATTVAATTVAATTAAPTGTAAAGTATTPAPTTAVPATPVPTTAPPATTAALPPPPPNPGPGECSDDHSACSAWAKNGQCQNNPGYMLNNCKLSCDACEGKVVKAAFRLTNEVYSDNLANSSSADFIALKNKVEAMFSAELNTTLGNKFLKFKVLNFKKGSVVINSEVTTLAENQNVADALVSSAIENLGISGLDKESSSVGGTACSTGFVDVNEQCLMFSGQRLSWTAAKVKCESLNSRLVVPTTFELLTSYILRKNIIQQYWVGASDQATPGTYEWLDGSSTQVDSDYWYPGYPETTGVNQGQSCVKLNPNSNTNYGLIAAYDTNCDGPKTYWYICEEN